MRTREKDQPHAHELYDLLADIHIRVSVFFFTWMFIVLVNIFVGSIYSRSGVE